MLPPPKRRSPWQENNDGKISKVWFFGLFFFCLYYLEVTNFTSTHISVQTSSMASFNPKGNWEIYISIDLKGNNKTQDLLNSKV